MEDIDAMELAFRERVRDAIQVGGKSALMSEKTGIPVGTLNKYVALRSSPNGINAWKIANAIGQSVNTLFVGGDDTASGNSQLGESHLARPDDFVRVPRYSVQASAGHELVVTNEAQEDSGISFARAFLRSLGVQPNACMLFEAKGDSMFPTVPGGSMILVDSSRQQIEDEAIFVFRVGPGIKVKRAIWRIDGDLSLVSDNEAAGYPPEVFGSDRAHELAPIGQVMMVMKTV